MMSGTSCDGIDAALVTFAHDNSYKLVWQDSISFKPEVRNRLLQFGPATSAKEILLGHSFVAELYADAIHKFLEHNSPKPDYIAAHGQTILHLPEPVNWNNFQLTGSMQLLNGSLLSYKTGIPVICNFREADMAAGGNGAPLVPFADQFFFGQGMTKDRIVLNIGGIANLTLLKPERASRGLVSAGFDTGPGNMLMDAFVSMISDKRQNYDENGRLAAAGTSNKEIVDKILEEEFFQRPAPKTTGREDFGLTKLKEILAMFPAASGHADIMSTLMDITVSSIVKAICCPATAAKFPAEVIVAGGGAYNQELLKRLQASLGDKCQLCLSSEFNIPVAMREAMCFAALGNACLKGVPANCPAATGATRKMILGQVHTC
jgi:anhydro-N-acetylmuramic acid kinase